MNVFSFHFLTICFIILVFFPLQEIQPYYPALHLSAKLGCLQRTHFAGIFPQFDYLKLAEIQQVPILIGYYKHICAYKI